MKHPSSIHGKLCHPTAESQLLGKWFGGIYETTKKKKHLHISDALNRFLKNDNGPMESLRLDFLTTHGGTDTLEKIPIYLEHYTFNFPA